MKIIRRIYDKDVLLSISGLHQDVTGIEAQGDEPGSEPIEVIVPASYYEKNGKHYVIYDELVEGIPGTIKNKVRILDDQKVEIIKSGITNTHMVFEKDKINMTQYETPYGEMMIESLPRISSSKNRMKRSRCM